MEDMLANVRSMDLGCTLDLLLTRLQGSFIVSRETGSAARGVSMARSCERLAAQQVAEKKGFGGACDHALGRSRGGFSTKDSSPL